MRKEIISPVLDELLTSLEKCVREKYTSETGKLGNTGESNGKLLVKITRGK